MWNFIYNIVIDTTNRLLMVISNVLINIPNPFYTLIYLKDGVGALSTTVSETLSDFTCISINNHTTKFSQ